MPSGPGRPRDPLPATDHPLTGRVRLLVDRAHGGNLSQAARTTGLAYPTVRDLYIGSTVNPSLETIRALAIPYSLDLDWFTGADVPERLPAAGIIGLLPPHPSASTRRAGLRRVLIPFAAWPMYDVYRRCATWLDGIEPAPERPIVEAGTGDSFTFRLTSWLLQPLLAAERLGEPDVIPFGADEDPEIPDGPVGEHWVLQLTRLGEMWGVVIEELISKR